MNDNFRLATIGECLCLIVRCIDGVHARAMLGFRLHIEMVLCNCLFGLPVKQVDILVMCSRSGLLLQCLLLALNARICHLVHDASHCV